MLGNFTKSLIKKIDFVHWLVILSFVIWMIGMREFLLLRLALNDDALPYYEHIKFFVENLMRGVVPFWDPVIMFCNGVPNDFFLRRIGPYNPFFLVIALLKSAGIPFQYAYTFYLAFYYWSGTIGFYLIAQIFLKDRMAAFAAYALLLFSSLGTRLFDSYIVFLFVPIVWFFYFLLKFSSDKDLKKFSFTGMIFTLMIIVTTYLPFYFLTILPAFVVSWGAVYPDRIYGEIKKYAEFIKQNKLYVLFCLGVLALALLPGALFYLSSKHGDIVMPHRSANASGGDVVEVSRQWIVWWGVVEEMIFSGYFLRYLSRMQYAVFYVPFFAVVIFAAGIFAKSNRRLLFLGVWTLLLFLIGVPRSSVYQFLSEHMFYFKYFRNLHFLLWIGILPVFILLLAEQFRLIRQWEVKVNRQKFLALAGTVILHAGLISFFVWWGKPLWSFYVMIVLSAVFWVFHWLGFNGEKIGKSEKIVYALLLAAVAIQPLEVYHHLSSRKPIVPAGISDYEKPYLEFLFKKEKKRAADVFGNYSVTPPTIFYATHWLNTLVKNINFDVYDDYAQYRFILYDAVEPLDEQKINFQRVEDALRRLENAAFVPASDTPGPKGRKIPPAAQPVLENSAEFTVLKYDMNSIKVKTNLPQEKFLVFNDSFHPSWKVFLNGKEAKIIRANIAFKGVWLPAGENTVFFRFGDIRRSGLEVLLLILFYAIFMGLFLLLKRSIKANYVHEN